MYNVLSCYEKLYEEMNKVALIITEIKNIFELSNNQPYSLDNDDKSVS